MAEWWDTGYEVPAEEESGRGKGIFRFYMPEQAKKPGFKTKITFVDDDTKALELLADGKKVKIQLPFRCHEHQFHLNGHWRNWFTCLTPMGVGCPACKAGNEASGIAVWTVIDHSVWTDKSGKTHKDELKLFVVKTTSAPFKLLKQQSEKRGGLRGCTYEVQRLGDKSPNVGDTFDFEEKKPLDAALQPFNYFEVFAPKSPAELIKVLGMAAEAAAGAEGAGQEKVNW